MPTITHSLIGGLLAFLIYLNSRNLGSEKEFSKSHLIIFTINSFIGPDIGKIGVIAGAPSYIINDMIHNIIGWIIFSIPLSILYLFIFNKFKSPKVKPSPISFPSILKLIIGAGVLHLGLDVLDQPTRVFPNFSLFPDWAISIDNLRLGHILAEGPLYSYFPNFGFMELFI
ncbi:MAG: hypothetical protein GF364_13000, partial [Candidatus Lokiarchaeota archaeon]|nr:hypothetical protein [Candidatus Lokiarchaeota archaeon]